MQLLKVKEILKIIKKDGWFHIKTKGSHRHFKHPTKKGKVTVPGKPSGELPLKTQKSIFK